MCVCVLGGVHRTRSTLVSCAMLVLPIYFTHVLLLLLSRSLALPTTHLARLTRSLPVQPTHCNLPLLTQSWLQLLTDCYACPSTVAAPLLSTTYSPRSIWSSLSLSLLQSAHCDCRCCCYRLPSLRLLTDCYAKLGAINATQSSGDCPCSPLSLHSTPPLPRTANQVSISNGKSSLGFFPAVFRFEFDFEFDFDFDFEFDLNMCGFLSGERQKKKLSYQFFVFTVCVCVFFVVSSFAFWGHSFSYAACCCCVVVGTGTGTLFVLVSPLPLSLLLLRSFVA